MRYDMEVAGRTRQLAVTRTGDTFAVTLDGRPYHVERRVLTRRHCRSSWTRCRAKATKPRSRPTRRPVNSRSRRRRADAVGLNGRRRFGRRDEGGGSGSRRRSGCAAPMPGKVVRVLVKAGDAVSARQPLVVVEAMKMENELRAGRDGTVAEVHAREGASVEAGALLIVIQ